MRNSPAFETHALMVFAVFDDVIDNLDGDVQIMLEKLESVARLHAKAEGFSFEFFQVRHPSRFKFLMDPGILGNPHSIFLHINYWTMWSFLVTGQCEFKSFEIMQFFF